MKFLKLLSWMLALFILYLAFEILRKVFGGSLGFEELIVGLLIVNLGYSFYMNSLLSEHIGWNRAQKNRAN